MEKFTRIRAVVAPLDRANVDTDAIIPKQFLKSIKRTGFGPNLFDEWRYLDHGEPGMDNSQRPVNRDFVLNQPAYKNARILLAKKNFGCGSSREHAPWALADYGFRVILAPSFADIFYNNCFKNGILPVILSVREIDELFAWVSENPGVQLEVDLPEQIVRNEQHVYHFELDEFRKYCLLQGLDEIDLTLSHADEIRAYEQQAMAQTPWLFAAQETS